MTIRQQDLVRTTFAKIPKEFFADVLYKKLFELEPKSQQLFRGDMIEQKRKLIRMLTIAMDNIDNHSELQPMLFNLGQIHHSFGIEGHQFSSFGEAMIFALQASLGKDYTPEIEEAWKAVYLYIAATMHNHPKNDNVQLPHH